MMRERSKAVLSFWQNLPLVANLRSYCKGLVREPDWFSNKFLVLILGASMPKSAKFCSDFLQKLASFIIFI